VDKKLIESFVRLSGMGVVLLMLSACSSDESAGWTKKASPWDHIRRSEPAVQVETQVQMEPELIQETPIADEPVAAELEQKPEVEASISVIGGGILELPATYYTVQLMASVDIDRVYRFADENQLSIKYVVPTNRDGMTWYVLLLDVYPDRESAVIGKNEVASILRTEPWIRNVGSIQQLIQ